MGLTELKSRSGSFGDAREESVHLLLWIECLCPPQIHMLKSVPSVAVVWRWGSGGN